MESVYSFVRRYGFVAIEEIFFRYLPFTLVPVGQAFLISSVVFALFHIRLGWRITIGALVLGLVLGGLYNCSPVPLGLIVCIILHTLIVVMLDA